METKKVKDLMVPLSEYATVSEEATLFDAVLALEEAQKKFDQSRYPHRAVLIYDSKNHIVGKVSQLDILKALEPKYREIENTRSIARFGYNPQYLKTMLRQFRLWSEPLDNICRKAAQMKIKDFMYEPSKGEYVDENASINEAIHQLVMGQHQSLLVTCGREIVGILRLTDVFKAVCGVIKSCEA